MSFHTSGHAFTEPRFFSLAHSQPPPAMLPSPRTGPETCDRSAMHRFTLSLFLFFKTCIRQMSSRKKSRLRWPLIAWRHGSHLAHSSVIAWRHGSHLAHSSVSAPTPLSRGPHQRRWRASVSPTSPSTWQVIMAADGHDPMDVAGEFIGRESDL